MISRCHPVRDDTAAPRECSSLRRQRPNDAYVAVQLGIRYTARMPAKKRLPNVGDRDLMRRAIDLARKCKSEPGNISPKVGAIVVRDGLLLGEAFRGELTPGEHAEFTLLEGKLADRTLAGATLFHHSGAVHVAKLSKDRLC